MSGKSALYGCTDIEPIEAENEALLKRLITNQQTDNAYQAVICSPLQRCQLLAVKFASSCHLPLEIQKGLQEMNFGQFDGIPFDEMYFDGDSQGGADVDEQHGDKRNNNIIKWSLLERFFQAPEEVTLPDAERLADFNQRVVQAWQGIIKQHFSKVVELELDEEPFQRKDKRRVLVIAHGGVIRMILADILSSNWRQANWHQNLQISQASLTRISITGSIKSNKVNHQDYSQQPLQLHQKILTISMPLLQEAHDRI